MRQLSEHDAAFIYSDLGHANANVTLLHIYDQSTAPGGVVRFKHILAQLESRLHRLPNLREKVIRVPLDLDYPYWIEDENFNIENHVRHDALPKPGDWRQFFIHCARFHARALDQQRPLWEMSVVEGLDNLAGLPNGSFAVLLKVHHAAIDVAHGNEITTLLHDLAPTSQAPALAEPWIPESAPDNLMLLARAGLNYMTFPLRLTELMSTHWTTFSSTVDTFVGEFLGRAQPFPMTRFNTVVSPQRVFNMRRFALADFKAIRKLAPLSTVNDVVLAVCAGAIRRYLALQNELPLESLVAAAPIAVHSEADPERRANFSWVRLALGTDIDDPVQRLMAIQAASSSSAAMAQALSARELTQWAQNAPSLAIAATSRMLRSASAVLGDWIPLANCAITNVPGTRMPLYLQGARLSYMSAIMPISDGMGLMFSVTGYNDVLIISFTACAKQLPDPEMLAQCLLESYEEYFALTLG
jgi:diacylglycerol O-acyltransferase